MEECREHSDTPTQLEHGPRRVLVGCLAAEAKVARRGTVACAGLRRNSWCFARSSEFQQQYDQRLAPRVALCQRLLLRDSRLRALCTRPAASTQEGHRPRQIIA